MGWSKLPENEMEPLMRAVVDGPVGISVAAADWKYYSHGIYDSCKPDAVIDHAVTLIGYGEETGAKYWTIQNSWGPWFGEDGLVRLLRHDAKADDDEEERHCGVDRQPEVGSGCKGGPSSARRRIGGPRPCRSPAPFAPQPETLAGPVP